jgi:hypothetical protein
MVKSFAITGNENYRCQVRLTHYGNFLSYFLALYLEAKKDFPSLTKEQVKVVQVGENTIRHYWGIEFSTGTLPPETYSELTKLPVTF